MDQKKSDAVVGMVTITDWKAGTTEYRLDEKLHREDGPAIERANGENEWYKKGNLWPEGQLVAPVRSHGDGPETDASGTTRWWRNGKIHRDGSPAIEWADGSKSWFLDGIIHREDGPAIEWTDGAKSWYRDGKMHREDGPAKEYPDGQKWWYRNGKYYLIEFPDGLKTWQLDDGCWILEGEDGKKWWYRNDMLHRDDGPAIEYPDGQKWWYRNGEQCNAPE